MIKENQNLEVAYNVAGSMSHLLSDGPEAWTCEALNRDMVRQNMYSVIESWNINASRSINYRCVEVLLQAHLCTKSWLELFIAKWLSCEEHKRKQ